MQVLYFRMVNYLFILCPFTIYFILKYLTIVFFFITNITTRFMVLYIHGVKNTFKYCLFSI